jgi:ribonuclease G
MTEFGLVQITRQRVRQNILHSFTAPCPACGGTGLVRSKTSTQNQLERAVRRASTETGERRLTLRVHPELEIHLKFGFMSRLRTMMLKNMVWITLETDPAIPVGEFRLFSRKQDRDITDQFK